MATIIIRNLPHEAHAKLKVLAAQKAGRLGVEGFARSILIEAANERSQTTWVDRMVAAQQAVIDRFASEAQEPISGDEMDRIFARDKTPVEFLDLRSLD